MLSVLALLALLTLLGLLAAAAGAQPPGAPISLGDSAGCLPHDPRLARHPDGGFVAAWLDAAIHLRRFDRHGAAIGLERVLLEPPPVFSPVELAVSTVGTVAVTAFSEGGWRLRFLTGGLNVIGEPVELEGVAVNTHPLVAADGDGFVAVWSLREALAVARFDPRGQPLAPVLEVPTEIGEGRLLDLVVQADGDLWLMTPVGQLVTSPPSGRVTLLRLPAGASQLETRNEGRPLLRTAALAAGADDEVVLALGTRDLVLLRLDDSLDRVSEPVTVERSSVPGDIQHLELTGDPVGNLVATWAEGLGTLEEPVAVFVQGVTPEGEPAGPASEAGTIPLQGPIPLTLGASPLEAGEAMVAWAGREVIPASLVPIPCETDPGPQAVRVSTGGPQALLLGDGRFRVEVEWQVPLQGTEGRGRALPESSDSGSFWFFEQDNVELTVKVLDGRPVNGHFWFFYGALSNVGYQITVTDQLTGRQRTYDNPPGRFGSLADTQAFPGGG